MPSFPDKIATVVEALNSQSSDWLKKLVQLLPFSKMPTRKDDRARLIASYLQGDDLKPLWSELDELQQAAVAEAVHSERSRYEPDQFVAKYGKAPDWGSKTRPYGYDINPSKLNLFFYNHILPEDLKRQLKAFVPKPKAVTIENYSELPDSVWLEFPSWSRRDRVEIPLAQQVMESSAQQDLLTVLRLAQSGKLAVSDKTRLPGTATINAIALVLQGGDYYSEHDEPLDAYDHIGNLKPFAWCLMLQAAGLAELAGKKLQLTKAGQKALTEPPATTIKNIWKKWLKTTLFDEFRRIDVIKGQTGKGARHLTAVGGRRSAIVAALSECAAGEWMGINEFFRYMQAKHHHFEVSRDPWTLYICSADYGSLGYEGFHDWLLLQGRYTLCFLFEYAATLGLIDVAYVPPYNARQDYRGNWGTDDLEFLSRYDGLMYIRLNALGAYCLELNVAFGSHERVRYTPTPIKVRPILKVMSNLELAITEELTMSDRLVLELYLEPVSDRVWKLNQEKILAAVEAGHAIAQLQEFLTARSKEALPQPVEQFLADLEERTQSIKSQGTAMLLECATPALAALIVNDSRTKKFCVLAGEKHLMVPLDAEVKFRKALRKLGYSFPK
jgi:Helicase conserved C-terminal domain